MDMETLDFSSRLRAHVELQGTTLTVEQLSRVEERYARCGGHERWDVREYAGPTGLGAREYRVLRGSSTQDVYRSGERDHATAVGWALNELEAEDRLV